MQLPSRHHRERLLHSTRVFAVPLDMRALLLVDRHALAFVLLLLLVVLVLVLVLVLVRCWCWCWCWSAASGRADGPRGRYCSACFQARPVPAPAGSGSPVALHGALPGAGPRRDTWRAAHLRSQELMHEAGFSTLFSRGRSPHIIPVFRPSFPRVHGWIERVPGVTRGNDGLETEIVWGATAAALTWQEQPEKGHGRWDDSLVMVLVLRPSAKSQKKHKKERRGPGGVRSTSVPSPCMSSSCQNTTAFTTPSRTTRSPSSAVRGRISSGALHAASSWDTV